MESSLKVINSVESTCGSCNTSGCGTCAPAPVKASSTTLFSRRELGRAALAAAATSVLAGCSTPQPPQQPTAEKSAPSAAPPPAASALSPELAVVQKSKGPIMTVLDEFYKMGPGPSSSHTMGPMRITYDFFQRVSKLPEDQLKRATALKVHLFGSLSATGKGHGTDRASLRGPARQSSCDLPSPIPGRTGCQSR